MQHLLSTILVSTTALILAIVMLPVNADSVDVQVHEENGVRYITGGVSDEEQAAIKDKGEGFNLELMMALKRGNYLADIPVKITDAQGNTVLDAVSQGPFLYADLKPGTYTVEAYYEGQAKEKTARIDSDQQEQLNFYWETTGNVNQ